MQIAYLRGIRIDPQKHKRLDTAFTKEPRKEDKECMGIMNYHRINELRESFPNQDYQAQMSKSPVCAATNSHVLFSSLDSRNPGQASHPRK